MRQAITLLALIVLWPSLAAAQTQTAPALTTTIVLPDSTAPASATTSATSTNGNAETTVTSVKREDGSATTVVTQQPQSSYLPMRQGGYNPTGRPGASPGVTIVKP